MIQRTRPMSRGKPPRNKKPLPKVNPKRAKRLRAEDFHSKEYTEWICSLPCAICEVYGWTVPAHARSRGAGGKASDIVPLCGNRLGMVGCHTLYDDYPWKLEPDIKLRMRSLAKRLFRSFQEQRDTQEEVTT